MINPTPIHIEIGPDLHYPYKVYEQSGTGRIHLEAYNDLAAVREDFPEATIPEEVLSHFEQARAWPVFYVEGPRSWVLVQAADAEQARQIGQKDLGHEPVGTVRLATADERRVFQTHNGELGPFQWNAPLPKHRRIELSS